MELSILVLTIVVGLDYHGRWLGSWLCVRPTWREEENQEKMKNYVTLNSRSCL